MLPVSNASVADLTSVDSGNRLLSQRKVRELGRSDVGDTIDGCFAARLGAKLSADNLLHILSEELATFKQPKKKEH